jgi:hypothetical protein
MRRLGILIAIVMLLVIGGGLTSLLSSSGGVVLPVLQQTNAIDASPTVMVPWKANQFFLLVGFILFNLVGIAVTIAIILWFVDRGVRKSRAEAQEAARADASEQTSASVS